MCASKCQAIIDLCRRKISFKDFYRRLFLRPHFDAVLSLGYNCEVTQRISDVFGGVFEHYLYSWSYERNRNLFLDSLNNLKDFANSNYSILSSGMILHERYNIAFHSRYKKFELFNEDGTYTSNVTKAISELKSRLAHLSQKTEKLFQSNKKVLFIIKIKHTDFNSDKEYIVKLNNILRTKFNQRNNYRLLVIISRAEFQDSTDEFCALGIKNVKISAIEFFAKDTETNVGGDIPGWQNAIKANLIRCTN